MRVPKFKKSKNKPKSKSPIERSHRLLLSSLRFYWQYRDSLLPVVLLVVVVNLVLGVGVGNESKALAQSLWFVFASCSLIWIVRHARDAHSSTSLSKAIYLGSAPAIKFLLVLMVLSAASIPFSIGLFLYAVISSITAGGASLLEQGIGVGLWSLFAAASLYLISRLLMSLIIVTLPEVQPTAAMRLSWRLSRGRVLSICGRLVVFALYSILIAIIPSIILSWLGLSANILQIVAQATAGLIVVPTLYIYSFKIYQQLQ